MKLPIRFISYESNLKNITYSIRRMHVDDFHRLNIPTIPSNSIVLDLGGNKVQKRGMFDITTYPLKVVYADLSRNKNPDVQSDADHLPFVSHTFDVVICSEVLEHVPDPKTILGGIQRVLKTNGTLFLCVPFLFRIHSDPYDFGRYTDFYWKQALEKAGFTVVSIEKQGLFWSVFVEMIRSWVYQKVLDGKLSQRWVIYLASSAIGWARKRALFHDCTNQNHSFYSSYTTGFGMIATKCVPQKRD